MTFEFFVFVHNCVARPLGIHSKQSSSVGFSRSRGVEDIYLNIFVVRLGARSGSAGSATPLARGRSATPGAMAPSPGTGEHPIGRTELLVTPIESP